MGDFRKNFLQTDFEGNNSRTEENISHGVYKKNLTPFDVVETISNSRGLGKKFSPKPNHPYLPLKSQMVGLLHKIVHRGCMTYHLLADLTIQNLIT